MNIFKIRVTFYSKNRPNNAQTLYEIERYSNVVVYVCVYVHKQNRPKRKYKIWQKQISHKRTSYFKKRFQKRVIQVTHRSLAKNRKKVPELTNEMKTKHKRHIPNNTKTASQNDVRYATKERTPRTRDTNYSKQTLLTIRQTPCTILSELHIKSKQKRRNTKECFIFCTVNGHFSVRKFVLRGRKAPRKWCSCGA